MKNTKKSYDWICTQITKIRQKEENENIDLEITNFTMALIECKEDEWLKEYEKQK